MASPKLLAFQVTRPASRRMEKLAGFYVWGVAGKIRQPVGCFQLCAGCSRRLAGWGNRPGFPIRRLAGCFQ
jgi:hypothetical protein